MSNYIGKIRLLIIHRAGALFRWLDKHNNFWVGRQAFCSCRWLWEAITRSKVYRIVSFSEYAKDHPVALIPIKRNRIGYAANAVSVGRGEKQELRELPLPDLNLYRLSEVYIHHGSDFIANINESVVINDYCAFKNDDNKGYEDQWYYWQGGKVVLLRKCFVVNHIEAGIMLNDKYSFNYYHNMYDNLIRLCALGDCNGFIPKDTPIIVDEEIYKVPSFKRIYDILIENLDHPTLLAKKGDSFFVDNLYYINPVNSLVPNHKDYTKGIIEDYLFDKDYTLNLRNKLLKFRDNNSVFSKRVFITRKNTTHRHFNEDELFEVLQPLGFQKVAPEEYSFEQQMTLFHDADIIIGSSGAALTNLLFTHKKCIIVCLYRNSDYIPPVFTAPACFNDAKMVYFQSSHGHSIMKAHTDFTIDVDDFRHFVKDCIEPAIT